MTAARKKLHLPRPGTGGLLTDPLPLWCGLARDLDTRTTSFPHLATCARCIAAQQRYTEESDYQLMRAKRRGVGAGRRVGAGGRSSRPGPLLAEHDAGAHRPGPGDLRVLVGAGDGNDAEKVTCLACLRILRPPPKNKTRGRGAVHYLAAGSPDALVLAAALAACGPLPPDDQHVEQQLRERGAHQRRRDHQHVGRVVELPASTPQRRLQHRQQQQQSASQHQQRHPDDRRMCRADVHRGLVRRGPGVPAEPGDWRADLRQPLRVGRAVRGDGLRRAGAGHLRLGPARARLVLPDLTRWQPRRVDNMMRAPPMTADAGRWSWGGVRQAGLWRGVMGWAAPLIMLSTPGADTHDKSPEASSPPGSCSSSSQVRSGRAARLNVASVVDDLPAGCEQTLLEAVGLVLAGERSEAHPEELLRVAGRQDLRRRSP
jgi:hypothetical protein